MKLRRQRIGQSWGLGRFLFLVGFTVVFTGLGLWQVRRQYEVISNGYKIDKDLFEYRRLLETEKRLSLLIAAYKDPTALENFAEDDLGMHHPERDEELVVPDPRTVAPMAPLAPLSPASPDDAPTPDDPAAAPPVPPDEREAP